jgi:hypothetical protein
MQAEQRRFSVGDAPIAQDPDAVAARSHASLPPQSKR